MIDEGLELRLQFSVLWADRPIAVVRTMHQLVTLHFRTHLSSGDRAAAVNSTDLMDHIC